MGVCCSHISIEQANISVDERQKTLTFQQNTVDKSQQWFSSNEFSSDIFLEQKSLKGGPILRKMIIHKKLNK